MGTLANVYAPPAYMGLQGAEPEIRTDPFDYVYDTVLTSLQQLQDQKSIDPDADFLWLGLSVSFNTGIFNVRFSDSRLYYLSDARMASALLTNNPPYALMTPIIIPAGGRIGIDIADTSAAGNTIQLVFRGAKRYRVR